MRYKSTEVTAAAKKLKVANPFAVPDKFGVRGQVETNSTSDSHWSEKQRRHVYSYSNYFNVNKEGLLKITFTGQLKTGDRKQFETWLAKQTKPRFTSSMYYSAKKSNGFPDKGMPTFWYVSGSYYRKPTAEEQAVLDQVIATREELKVEARRKAAAKKTAQAAEAKKMREANARVLAKENAAKVDTLADALRVLKTRFACLEETWAGCCGCEGQVVRGKVVLDTDWDDPRNGIPLSNEDGAIQPLIMIFAIIALMLFGWYMYSKFGWVWWS